MRDARLLECVDLIRALLRGEEVSHDGLVRVDRARLWSLPDRPPPLIGAAVSEQTARVVGGWGDGLITINQSPDALRRVLDAFRDGGGAGKPVHLQVHLSWAEDDDTALAIAHDQWRSNVLGSSLAWNLELPQQFDDAATFVRPDDVVGPVLVSGDLGRHAAWLVELRDLGVDSLMLHHVGNRLDQQQRFIEAFADKVLPELVVSTARTSDLWWKNAVVYCLESRPTSTATATASATCRASSSGSTTWPTSASRASG